MSQLRHEHWAWATIGMGRGGGGGSGPETAWDMVHRGFGWTANEGAKGRGSIQFTDMEQENRKFIIGL